MPVEYCSYSANPEKCKQWLESHLPEMFASMYASEAPEANAAEDNQSAGAAAADLDGKKSAGRQKRGGKGSAVPGASKKQPAKQQQRICISRAPRGKNKFVTVITGLTTCEIDLKAASKLFAQKFACGSSVTGGDEIVIQGDVKDDLIDLIPEKWPNVDEDSIEDLGDLKR